MASKMIEIKLEENGVDGLPEDSKSTGSRTIKDTMADGHLKEFQANQVPAKKGKDGKQSSLVTIFTIWNLTLGTSLLSIPWAIGKAGLILGPLLIVLVNLTLLYSCYLVVEGARHFESKDGYKDFNDVIRYFLGSTGEKISCIIISIVLIGVCLIYWILASNFLYTTVYFVRDRIIRNIHGNSSNSINMNEVVCPAVGTVNSSNFGSNWTETDDDLLFNQYWNQTQTVPLYLILILFPILNLPSPVIFNKLSSIGILSSIYMVIFVIIKSSFWTSTVDANFELALPTFPIVTGVVSTAFSIHANLLPVTQCNRNPQNTVRDLTIAYGCSCVTYLLVGILFIIKFPLSAQCIQSVFLDNFGPDDIMSFLGRLTLLIQNIVTCPIIAFAARIKIMSILYGEKYPSWKHVLVFNILLTTVCVLGAIFFPNVGTIVRYVGAFGGLFYCLFLPCAVQFAIRKKENRLTVINVLSYTYVIVFGLANCIAQFFMN
ncbi:Sodium-coupled neutral amino acid transporter 9 [Trichoplax sp. H2]|nr:Sodium-coupled neutral amino acid transporter 9 [Trichoplax sp. H2]|eukprot:RDD42280.1 Sodium-coupled neutral amino acid transporter 9 [Trichoplax sp. H2]